MMRKLFYLKKNFFVLKLIIKKNLYNFLKFIFNLIHHLRDDYFLILKEK